MAKQQTPKAAASNEGQPQKTSKGYTVLSPFRDRDNWDKEYKSGDDVSHFDRERLDRLVKNKMVQAPKTAVKATETTNPADEPPVDGQPDENGVGDEGGEDPKSGDNLD